MPPSERYVSPAAAAEIFSVTPPTIRALIARGELPAYRLGGKVLRIKLSDLEALARPVPTVGHF